MLRYRLAQVSRQPAEGEQLSVSQAALLLGGGVVFLSLFAAVFTVSLRLLGYGARN